MPARFIWVIVVGLVSAVVGATLAFQGAAKHSILYAANSPDNPLFGASASNPGWLARSTAQFGHMPIIRAYYRELPNPGAWTSDAVGLSKSAVVVSFNAPAQQILSGADDATLSHFFDTAPGGHPIYYSYYPEPETYIEAGKFTAAQYRAAWAHIVSLAVAAHNADLQSTLVLTNWDLNPQSGRNWKNYLPGGGIISTLGWDAYPAGTVENRDPQLTPPAQFMGPAVAASRSVGLPFGFAEFALGRADGRPAWLAEVANYLTSVGALFGTLFNSSGFPSMEVTDAASIAAWRTVVARSGSTVPLAPQPPVKHKPHPGAPAGLQISGLAARHAAFTADGHGHATLVFRLTQHADVTVCILDSTGTLVRQIARPSRAAGSVRVSFNGFAGGRPVPAGRYPVLVVASNSRGSTTAQTVLTIRHG